MASPGGRGFGDGDVKVTVDQAALDALVASPAGPAGRLAITWAQETTQIAKRNAPVGANSKTPEGHPGGWLRSHGGWNVAVEGGQIVAVVVFDAVTSRANPFPGEPYPLHIEDPSTRPRKPPPFARDDKPFLVPAALEALRQVFGGGFTYTPRA